MSTNAQVDQVRQAMGGTVESCEEFMEFADEITLSRALEGRREMN